MSDWTLYVARRITSNNQFDPSQIEEGLKLGLMPQVLLESNVWKPDIINSLFEYLKHKEIAGIPVKITAHGRGESNEYDIVSPVEGGIDAVIELNKKYGRPIINEIVYHAGSVHTLDEELRLRTTSNYSNLDATFTAKEYLETLEKIKSRIARISEYAEENGIQILIENVPQVDFASVPTKKIEDKPTEFRKDPRLGNTFWLPETMQVGMVGCVHDLDYLVNGSLPVCIDVEHLGHSVEYSQEFNLVRFPEKPKNDEEKRVLDDYGILIRKGKPILYRFPVNPVEFISRFKGRIPMCHLGGAVNMVYEDNGIKKISAHFPVTFGKDPNEFIEEDSLRMTQNSKREEILKKYIEALHDAGCRQGTFEIHLGDMHVGKTWRKYLGLSLKNIRNILDRF